MLLLNKKKKSKILCKHILIFYNIIDTNQKVPIYFVKTIRMCEFNNRYIKLNG